MTVTVLELIKELEKFNQNDVVIMSKDMEGNDFSPLTFPIEEYVYAPETDWYGSIHPKELTKELLDFGYCEEDLCYDEDGVNAIVLWPTN